MAGRRERLTPLARSRADDREVTVYVKGFLSRGERPEHFDAWLDAHRTLEVTRGWGPRVLGWSWETGRPGRPPVPVESAAKLAWDVARRLRGARAVGLSGNLAVGVAELALRLAGQYVVATRAAQARAEVLADRLSGLARRYERVRVVAHSLGCRHVIEAVAHLPRAERPNEIHLCAAACRERDVAASLSGLARGRTHLYFARNDLVLATAFRLMARGRALGAVGPGRAYARLRAHEVGAHFGFFVHHDYARRFPDFAGPLAAPI